jgi:hypothetical protein
MICSESFCPSLYKPYFGLYKQRFSRSLDSFFKLSIYSFDSTIYKLYFSSPDHLTCGHLTQIATDLVTCIDPLPAWYAKL